MAASRNWADTSFSFFIICSLLLFHVSYGNIQEPKYRPLNGPDENVSKPGWPWSLPKPEEKPHHEHHHKEECNCNCSCNCPPTECPPRKGSAGLVCAPLNCDPKHGCNFGDAMNFGMGTNFNLPFFGAVGSGAPQADAKPAYEMNDTDARQH